MKRIILLTLLVATSAFAQMSTSFNALRLNPLTLPSTCASGSVRFDSTGHILNYCYPSNTWNGISFSSMSPLTTLGDLLYENSTPMPVRLAGNTSSTTKFLSQTGNGSVSAAPSWLQPSCSNLSNAAASCSTDTTNASNISSGTLSNARTTATSANTVSTIVARDSSGNFSAGTVTAALTGTASGNTTYSANNHGVVVSGSGNTMTVIAPDASTTKVLTSGGLSADPSWQDPTGGGAGGLFSPSPNLVVNSGWETNTSNWTASGGTYSRTTTAANVGNGTGSASWDSSAASQTLTSDAMTIPAGLYLRAGVASCNIQGSGATHLLQAYDGTNVLGSATITSGTNYARTSVNFTFPNTGSIYLRLKSVASNEPVIYIDDCYIGDAEGFNTFNQQIASDWKSDLTFTTTGFGTISNSAFYYKRVGDTMMVRGHFTAGTTVSACGVNLPSGLTIDTSKLPSSAKGTMVGQLMQHEATSAWWNNATVASSPALYYDGSTNSEVFGSYISDGSSNYSNNCAPQASNEDWDFTFSVPITQWANSGTVYRPDQVGNSWSGYHDSDCSWSVASASFGLPTADTTCTFTERQNANFGTVTSYNDGTAGHNYPGIVFTPSRAGRYFVCANSVGYASNTNSSMSLQLSDGTTEIATGLNRQAGSGTTLQTTPVCGIYKATNTSAVTLRINMACDSGSCFLTGNGLVNRSIEWSIFQIDQAFPATLLTGSPLVAPVSNVTPLTVKGASSQSANLQEWQNSSGTVLGHADSSGFLSNGVQVAVVSDQKASGTNGGISTAGSWQPRTLNTLVAGDTGITLSSNDVTVPAGTWKVFCQAPFHGIVNRANTRLQNITDSTTALNGTSVASTGGGTTFHSYVEGVITLAAAKALELQYQVQTSAGAAQDLGFSSGGIFTVANEVYSTCEYQRLK